MSIGEAIRTLLLADANVLAAVGQNIYPKRVLSNNASIANPVIVYNIDVIPQDDKDGPASIDHAPFQLDVYTNSYDTSISIAADVRTALDRQSGLVDEVNIDTIIFQGQEDLYDDIAKSDRVIMDFRIRIKL